LKTNGRRRKQLPFLAPGFAVQYNRPLDRTFSDAFIMKKIALAFGMLLITDCIAAKLKCTLPSSGGGEEKRGIK
jgi:hypothetical protein